ncbi:winged helix DNA-binding domain-containing protein [Leifsonia sp. NPDC080035]|uniref:Winged helix DNA-binding domain-containing protein n=1 Tax=Leifsonia sp. NPDC080035 TaxID=3143936 RepID=A0AAU7GD39_9MICO
MTASRTDVLRMRRLAQAIDGDREHSPADVVRRMLAVQAQDFGAACWALGLRTTDATRSDVLADLDAGRIVRSWPMRGTLHFVPTEDLRWMLSVTTERMVAGLARRHAELELADHDFGRARDLLVAELEGGRSIGRADLMALWEGNGIATAGQRGYHLIYYLAQTGVVCWGPTHRTQQALVLLDEWAPQGRSLEEDEAHAEFLLRYLTGHGPATLKDFVWWTKGTVAGAKRGLAVLGDAVTTLEVEGTSYLVTAELADRAAAHPERRSERDAVHLLPGFDEYLLGFQDRSPILEDEHAAAIVPGGNGVFQPIIVARGRIVGTWRTGGAKGEPEARPFGELGAGQRAALARSARAYRRFAD